MTRKTKNNPESFKMNPSHYFLLLLVFLSIFACYKIVSPYLHAIILAAILAIVLSPVHRKIEKICKNRKNLAALASCLLLTLVVVLPLTGMVLAMIHQGIESFTSITSWIKEGHLAPLVDKGFVFTEKYIPVFKKIFPDFDPGKLDIEKISLDVSRTFGAMLLAQGKNIAGNVTSLVGKFFFMIFSFFFIIRDQKTIFEYILHLAPLSSSHESQIMEKIKSVSKSALLGTLVTALAQGAAGGIAFKIAGLPGFFWGMVMAFASLIPIVGTALIWVPAAGYLFVSGHVGYGVFMVLWCVIVVGMIDNLVRPLFMQGAADMSTFLIFIAILGGLNYFGLIGLLYGPLIFGITMVLLYIYSLEFEAFLTHQDDI